MEIHVTYQRLAFFVAAVCAQTLLLSGCAKDLIVDMGGGDSMRLVGHADNFECNDPAYAHIKKVKTFKMAFADGSSIDLCTEEGARNSAVNSPTMRAPSVSGSVSR